MTNDELVLRVGVGSGDLGRVKNQALKWEKLREKLRTPLRNSHHTLAEYKALPQREQDRLKSVGFFVGGQCDGGLRKAAAIQERSLISLDIDAATPDQMAAFRAGKHGITDLEWFAHTTRKHSSETPRWRLIIPLAKPVVADKYGPLARIVASRLFDGVSASMDAVDDVSFRLAQIMYWPSACRDAEFDTIENHGVLLDGDSILEEFGDWRDWTKLPYSEARTKKRPTDPTRKAENPREKRGIVGAFCRAYDVPEAIDKFLSDVYAPGDAGGSKPRYSYLAGSTANGAIVEDGGLFLYSHHGTDPVSDRLVNAFDLVRIHLFGDQDESEPEDAGPTSLPSYKAMSELARSDEAVLRELQAEQYDVAAMFGDLDEAEDAEIEDLIGVPVGRPAEKDRSVDSSWLSKLEVNEHGHVKPTLPNVTIILQHDPRFKGAAAFNEFTGQIVAMRSLNTKLSFVPNMGLRDVVNGDLWSARHDIVVRGILEAPSGKGKVGYGMRVSDRDLVGGIDLAATMNKYHPVRAYLDGLVWDGKRRLDRLFIDYLGAPKTAYSRETARLFLTAAVTRIYEPGHKFDHAVILEGVQGVGKSSFARILGRGRWFSELHGDLGDRKAQVENMMGYWILELPELAGLRKTEVDDTKAFLSNESDSVRLAYERRSATFLRQQVFIGTTNDRHYLRDETGNRRFWPVPVNVKAIDTEKLEAEMDQIWAEAVEHYRSLRIATPRGNLPLYLRDPGSLEEALKLQESRRSETAEEGLAGQIIEWLDKPVPLSVFKGGDGFEDQDADRVLVRRTRTCLSQIWVEALGRDRRQYGPQQAQMMNRAMRFVRSWTQARMRRLPVYGAQRVWIRGSLETENGYEIIDEEDLLG